MELSQRFNNALIALASAVAKCVVPIYVVKPNVGLIPGGSAVLLRPRTNRVLLLTAGHVCDNGQHSTLFTRGSRRTGLVQIAGAGFTSEPSDDSRRNDTVDLAIVELTPRAFDEILETEAGYAPLCAIATYQSPPPGIYGFIGFPEALNEFVPEFDRRRGFVRPIPSEPVIIFAKPATPEEYRIIGFSPKLTFVGAFDRPIPDCRSPNGQPLPPQGLSGGGVFYFGTVADVEAGSADVRLVGITTHFYESKRLIVAANGCAVSRMLRALRLSC